MIDIDLTTIIGAAFAFIAGGGGMVLLNWFQKTREQNREDKHQSDSDKRSENEQAFGIYKEIIVSLRHDLETLNKEYGETENKYMESKEAAVICKIKLETALAKIEELGKIIQENKNGGKKV